MIIGINTPFLFKPIDEFSVDLKNVFKSVSALNLLHFRIPIEWRKCQYVRGGKLVWDENEITKLKKCIQNLPPRSKVMAAILHPPYKVCVDYYYEQSTMGDRFFEFVQDCAKYFPEITEWEVWNEPNTSDFYLSVKDGEEHRPWTPEEFVRDIVVPGCKALRQVAPSKPIGAPPVAENGIIGHFDRPPALCNQLSVSKEFQHLRSSSPHGHFYLIPDFLDGYIDSLKSVSETDGKRLFDAIGLHPYPYFQIHRKDNPDVLKISRELTHEFIEKIYVAGFDNIDIWVSEIGLRSLDVSAFNYLDEKQQANFLYEFLRDSIINERVKRIYWYKLLDSPFDLHQEKTFGLLNHEAQPKQAFFVLRRHLILNDNMLDYFYEDFAYGLKFGEGCVDPALWKKSSNSHFDYLISANDNLGNKYALLSPGRGVGDWMKLKTLVPLLIKDQGYFRLDLGYKIISKDVGFDLSLCLHDSSTDAHLLEVKISVDRQNAFFINVSGYKEEFYLPDDAALITKRENLTGVVLEVISTQLYVTLSFGVEQFARYFKLANNISGKSVCFSIKSLKTTQSRGYIQLSDLTLSARTPDKSFNQLPKNIGLPEKQWTFLWPRVSQIHQDEWVLRATGFKRDGYFIEIGGHDGLANSNTVLLERRFGWQGIVVEANPRWFKEVCKNRACVVLNYAIFNKSGQELEFVDAGAVGGLLSHIHDDLHAAFRKEHIEKGAVIKVQTIHGDQVFQQLDVPKLIDYLSVDTEGSEFEVLLSINFNEWKVCLLTVEHGGNEEKREKVWDYLSQFGYKRYRVWFEDWFYHVDHLAELKNTNKETEETHMEKVFKHVPYVRSRELIEQARSARTDGNSDMALELYEEGIKSFYPDNIQIHLELSTIYEEKGLIDRAMDTLSSASDLRPNHRQLLIRMIIIFVKNGRYGRLIFALERMLRHHPDAVKEDNVSKALENVRSDLLFFMKEKAILCEKNPLVANWIAKIKS